MKKFAQLLERYIESSGMKQTHVASTANISYNYLQRLLAGDRNPSDQVVHKLAQALHLTTEQTGELLAAGGYAPPVALLQAITDQKQANNLLPVLATEVNQATRLAQQFYRLTQDIPEALQAQFLEEMKHLLGYIRYKYILSGGTSLLDLNINLSNLARTSDIDAAKQDNHLYLNLIAQLVGELHIEPEEEDEPKTEESSQPPQAVEDMLSAIDRLTGNILTGEMSLGNYQPHLIAQTLDMLREGAPWEIRRRIAEALPGLCQLDVPGAEHLMEALRLDIDEVRGVDIRRRVIEALPALIEASASSLPVAITLLLPKQGDDKYVAIATVEACGDIQARVKRILESNATTSSRPEVSRPETLAALLQQSQAEISKIQRQLLATWEGPERESLQFSMALHNLLCAPDTLLLSLREGLQSTETLLQWVAARYLERLLPSRPLETLELYKLTDLATDPDIYIRRAVADHAMQIFHIDREFLLILLRHMHKDTDLAIRHRLQPVALRLAQVWLIWYAETAGLVDTKRIRNKTVTPFGE